MQGGEDGDKIKTVLAFVAVVCAAAIGFILLYNPKPDVTADVLEINSEPVAMGPEVSFNSDLQLICEGEGAIEVTPYKSSYSDGRDSKIYCKASGRMGIRPLGRRYFGRKCGWGLL